MADTQEPQTPDVVLAICPNCYEHRSRGALMYYKEFLEDGMRYAGYRCGNCKCEVQPSYIGLFLEHGVMMQNGSIIESEGNHPYASPYAR